MLRVIRAHGGQAGQEISAAMSWVFFRVEWEQVRRMEDAPLAESFELRDEDGDHRLAEHYNSNGPYKISS